MKKLAIVVLSIATAFSGMPAWAGPAFVTSPVQSTAQPENGDAQILTVGCNNFTKCPRQFNNGGQYRNRDYSNRNWDRDDRHWDRGNRRYYGDRYRYRRHDNDNTGAIIGGLAAGAILGGIIASQPRVRSYSGSSHAEYCYSRYRSYRAYDNTYQPNYGPRRQCM
jgi:hypothetical protein